MLFNSALRRLSIDLRPCFESIALSIYESLPHTIPKSLQVLRLAFGCKTDALFDDTNEDVWKEIDKELSGSHFPDLKVIEIQWDLTLLSTRVPTADDVRDSLVSIDSGGEGVFKRMLPGIYQRGLLWCGYAWGSNRMFLVGSGTGWACKPLERWF